MNRLKKVIQSCDFPASSPTLVLVVETDMELAIDANKVWEKKNERNELQIVTGLGHCVNVNHLEKCYEILSTFLENTHLNETCQFTLQQKI